MINTLPLLLLALLVTAAQVNGQCSLSKRGIEDSNGVFTYVDADGNQQLLKTDRVDNGITLTMHCSQNEMHQTTCQRNRQLNPPLPLVCNNPLTAPGVMEVPNNDLSCKATMYAIGYNFNNRFLELYRACYSPQNVRSYFSDATLYPKTIFPKRPCMRFTTDQLITPAQEASFLTKRISEAFLRIYGQNHLYLRGDKDVVINRGHLTASADFLFVDQSCGTFKYLNVVPQFKTINDGNWKAIEEWVRSQIPANSVLRVRTGALEVLSLRDATPSATLKPAYLYGNNQNPVPKWMYKIVRNANNQPLYAFITYNNIYSNEWPPTPVYCSTRIQCPTDLTPNGAAGYTFCCDPASFKV